MVRRDDGPTLGAENYLRGFLSLFLGGGYLYCALGPTPLKRLATKIMIAAWYYDNRRRFLAPRRKPAALQLHYIELTKWCAELYIIINVADSDLTDL